MQAMMVSSSLALLSLILPPVSIVSSASIALVTLRRGSYEGFYTLLGACVSAALLGSFLFGSFQFALFYGLILWLPIWSISIILREGNQLIIAIQSAILLGVLGVIGFYLYVNNPAEMWYSVLNQMVQPMLENSGETPVGDIQKSLKMFSHYMTGGITAGMIYGLIFSLFLARYWQSVLYNPDGFRKEYLSLRATPKVAIGSLLIVAVAWLTSGVIAEVSWNITVLFIVLYTFIGTSILHTSFSVMKRKRFMVPFLYVTLVMIPHVIIIVIIVGVIDVWLDLRSKISNNNKA